MAHPFLVSALADEHQRDLRAAACRDRLASLARRCRPNRLRAWLRRDCGCVNPA